MPRILINERDFTSPGTPGGYANYSVLVAGFMPRTPILTADAEAADPAAKVKADKVQPDSNGVYEFSSADDFKDTIGLCGPVSKNDNGVTVYHYGNQMAYELLNIGYTVIYLPIKDIAEVADADTWAIFKDKASYDFRFIVHGLLETSEDTGAAELENRAKVLSEAISALKNLILEKVDGETNNELEATDANEAKYQEKVFDIMTDPDNESYNANLIPGVIDPATKAPYTSLAYALEGIENEQASIQEALSERGGVDSASFALANTNIALLAKYMADNTTGEDPNPGRGDCVALIELDEKTYVGGSSLDRPEVRIINAINEMPAGVVDNGSYCALTVPSVVYSSIADTKDTSGIAITNKKLPGSFHYLACFMNSLRQGFSEWYAAAGYTRGVSAHAVKHTTVKLGEIAINALEPRNLVDDENAVQPNFACNVIANFRGSYYLWGNRTAHKLTSKAGGGDLIASDFLNIRQLCITLKKQLYVACRRFTFDPNSDSLWFNFVNAIKPTLEAMKADQGIRDYRILKVYTDKKATLKAKIRVIPIEAVEDFDIEVSLEDSFGETTVTTN